MTSSIENFPVNAKYIFLDTETTGLIKENSIPAPLQIGLLFCDEKMAVAHEFSSFYWTRENIDTGAFKVHGIGRSKLEKLVMKQNKLKKREELYERLPEQSMQIREIVRFLLKSNAFVCAHNLDFDWSVLTNAVGKSFFAKTPLSKLKNPVCTLRNESTLKASPDNYGRFYFKSLDNLAKRYGIRFKRKRNHCALNDCKKHREVVKQMIRFCKELGNSPAARPCEVFYATMIRKKLTEGQSPEGTEAGTKETKVVDDDY